MPVALPHVAELRESLGGLLAGHPEIVFAILYGSAAERVDFRDIDVAVYVDEALLPQREHLGYAFDLADRLQRALVSKVDVRVINRAPLSFRYNVSRGVPICARDEAALADFLSRTWDEYFDFEPVANKYLDYMRTSPRYANRR
jgi:predicted nucleotidyltransferase